MAERLISELGRMGYLTSLQVAEILDVTYAVVNRIAEAVDWTPGQGRHRRWSWGTVRKMLVARAVYDRSAPVSPPAGIIPITVDFLAAPDPPEHGWVAYQPGVVRYAPTPAGALGSALGAVLVRIPNLQEEYYDPAARAVPDGDRDRRGTTLR